MDEPELVHYNPKDFDFGKKKVVPPLDQAYAAHSICVYAEQMLFRSPMSVGCACSSKHLVTRPGSCTTD